MAKQRFNINFPSFRGFSFGKKQLDTKNQAFNVSTLLNSTYAAGPEHQLEALLNECSTGNKIPPPRQWMKLSRLLYSKITIYKDAVDKTADFVGNVYLETAANISDRTRDLISNFWSSVAMYGESDLSPTIYGIDSIVNELTKSALRDGMGFAEDRFEEIGEEITEDYEGIMIFDSENFEYANVRADGRLSLRYCGDQYPEIDPETGQKIENQYFHILKIEHDTRAPWGLPLAAGDEMIAKVVIALLISIELQAKRFGNPPTLTTISPKDLEKMGMNDYEIDGKKVSPQDALILSVRNLKKILETSWALAHKGKAAEAVQGFPAPVDISSRVLGEGMVNMIDPDLLWRLSVILINGFGVPPALMGINITSGGMNSDMFQTSIQVFRSRIAKIRARLIPIIKSMTANYLLSEGVSPVEVERIEIGFEDVDLQSASDRAGVEKIQAETKRLQIENYEILQNYDEGAARIYAEENGILSRD